MKKKFDLRVFELTVVVFEILFLFALALIFSRYDILEYYQIWILQSCVFLIIYYRLYMLRGNK